ncbi:hypothetical protein ACFWH1_18490 [Streptomyces sp. NPDC127037]|uniref:hypothetical protein n=1 Tax=Streptomyces sp. NPDC127037 TaxID=3347113 RepID=UPI003650359A
MTSTDIPEVRFTAYGPDRFAEHLPFGRLGYLFTVPGEFPEDTPSHTNFADCEMAVYRTGEPGADAWEVRGVNGERRVWGVAGTRREAVGLALLEIARARRARAVEIAERRAACGLETVPPYKAEITDSVTLVLTAQAVATLVRIEVTEPGTPARYHVSGINTGKQCVIEAGEGVELHQLDVGVLHIRCGCDPDSTYFEHKDDALAYVREELASWAVCPHSPGAPAAEDQQADDEGPGLAREADMATVARTIRSAFPTATELVVRAEDYTVTTVLAGGVTVWTEHESELPEGLHFELVTYLADLLKHTGAPTRLGWQETTKPGEFTVALPPVAL